MLKLNLLPLTYDREIKDLIFFYRSLHGNIDLDIRTFVEFLKNGHTLLSQTVRLTSNS